MNNSDNENEESDDSLSETRRHFSESESGSDTAFPSRKIGKRGKKLNKKVCKRKSVLLKKISLDYCKLSFRKRKRSSGCDKDTNKTARKDEDAKERKKIKREKRKQEALNQSNPKIDGASHGSMSV